MIRSHLNSAAFVAFLAFGAFPTPSAAEVTEIAVVRGWSINFASGKEEGCIAIGSFRNGSTFLIGKYGPEGRWDVIVQNDKWRSIKEGETYEIVYVFNRRNKWTGESEGTPNAGFRSSGIKDEFVADFARSSGLTIMYKDTELGSFDLDGTRAAVGAINRCHSERISVEDPFAEQSDDPFADSNSESPLPQDSSDPFSTSPSETASKSPPISSVGENESKKTGRRLLQVDGKVYLRGGCPIRVEEDGSFCIGCTDDPAELTYLAMVDASDGMAFWNGEERASHAHGPLGYLKRRGACWENERARVCAWK